MVAVAASALLLEAFVALQPLDGNAAVHLPLRRGDPGRDPIACGWSRRRCCSTGFGRTPEEVRENSLAGRLRYRGEQRTLALPFAGKWSVWQGNDGRWTHQGIWRYAYDFVIVDDEGETHRDEGGQLKDYYCYRMPVLSPVAGRVVRVVNDMADNPVGTVSGGSNWGNLVLLARSRAASTSNSRISPRNRSASRRATRSNGGPCSACAATRAIRPSRTSTSRCKATESPTAATLPFSFVNYVCGDAYHANDLPAEGLRIEPLCREKRLDEATSFVLDDVQQFEVFRDGRPAGELDFRVGIAADGTRYLESDRGQTVLRQARRHVLFLPRRGRRSLLAAALPGPAQASAGLPRRPPVARLRAGQRGRLGPLAGGPGPRLARLPAAWRASRWCLPSPGAT